MENKGVKIKRFGDYIKEDKKNISAYVNINKVVRQLKKEYIATINNSIPYISVCHKPNKYLLEKPGQSHIPVYKREYDTMEEYINSSSIWFAQGDDAQNILDEVPDKISAEDYVLFYLDSVGVL